MKDNESELYFTKQVIFFLICFVGMYLFSLVEQYFQKSPEEQYLAAKKEKKFKLAKKLVPWKTKWKEWNDELEEKSENARTEEDYERCDTLKKLIESIDTFDKFEIYMKNNPPDDDTVPDNTNTRPEAENEKDALEKAVKQLSEHNVINNINPISKKTWLFEAVEDDDDEKVLLLLQYGANTELSDETGDTPLSAAASLGHSSCLKILLQHGANPNQPDEELWTPLMWAAHSGHLDCLALLLNSPKIDKNAANNGNETALDIARDALEEERDSEKIEMRTKCVNLLIEEGVIENIG